MEKSKNSTLCDFYEDIYMKNKDGLIFPTEELKPDGDVFMYLSKNEKFFVITKKKMEIDEGSDEKEFIIKNSTKQFNEFIESLDFDFLNYVLYK